MTIATISWLLARALMFLIGLALYYVANGHLERCTSHAAYWVGLPRPRPFPRDAVLWGLTALVLGATGLLLACGAFP